MKTAVRPAPATEELKKQCLLEAAIGVFARYGYRKSSMEEVARAARISRQGLYLHFPAKEELFRAMVNHVLSTSLHAAQKVLRQEDLPLDIRLLRAFDQWMGKYVGVVAADASDLVQAAQSLVGGEVQAYERRFFECALEAVTPSVLAKTYAGWGISPAHLISSLVATARGLKCHCGSRAEFCQEFESTLRILFAKVP